MIFNQWGILRY